MAFGVIGAWKTPEDQTERNADELHQQECEYELEAPKTQLGAIDCSHADDGSDAIVVDEKCDEEFE